MCRYYTSSRIRWTPVKYPTMVLLLRSVRANIPAPAPATLEAATPSSCRSYGSRSRGLADRCRAVLGSNLY